MKTHWLLLTGILIGLFSECSEARERVIFQPPSGPRTSWRGRIVIRHGLFHDTYRERWGNGLTPQGGVFLNNAVTTIAPMIPGIVGIPQIPGPAADGSGGNGLVEDNGDSDGTANSGFGQEAGEINEHREEIRTKIETIQSNLEDSRDRINNVFSMFATEFEPVEFSALDEDGDSTDDDNDNAPGLVEGDSP